MLLQKSQGQLAYFFFLLFFLAGWDAKSVIGTFIGPCRFTTFFRFFFFLFSFFFFSSRGSVVLRLFLSLSLMTPAAPHLVHGGQKDSSSKSRDKMPVLSEISTSGQLRWSFSNTPSRGRLLGQYTRQNGPGCNFLFFIFYLFKYIYIF